MKHISVHLTLQFTTGIKVYWKMSHRKLLLIAFKMSLFTHTHHLHWFNSIFKCLVVCHHNGTVAREEKKNYKYKKFHPPNIINFPHTFIH